MDDIRSQFPILARSVNGQPLVYLDNAATTQKPQRVIDAVSAYYRQTNANVHRGVHALSEEATAAYEEARKRIATFLHARVPQEIVFTRGTTESLNLIATAWARRRLAAGDELLVTEMEHHSNIVPWQEAARAAGATVRYAAITPDGRLDEEDFLSQLSEKTKIVALSAMSNVLGTVPPVRRLIKDVRERTSAIVVVDAAQAAAHIPIDVQSCGCDFLALSGHKMYGPMGIGILYGTEARLAEMEPYQYGGDMIAEVRKEGSTWNELPYKFEAGTPNVAGAVGLGEAVSFIESVGFDAVTAHETELVGYALEKLMAIPGLRIIGPTTTDHRMGSISFVLEGIHAHDLASVVDQHGVAIRSGHHCAQILMESLGLQATARASLAAYSTTSDIDRLVSALGEAKKILS